MKTFRMFALVGASSLAFAQSAFGQSAATDDPAQTTADDPAIIVSARRRDEVLQDVPIVVNAVTADSIAKLNLRKFEDIQQVVPGLQMRNNTNGIGTVSSVRGVNFDVNVSGNSGTIEYYFNDAPISSGTIFNSMYDIGQIEVLRGPQGTLRGRASPSGSITITTHRPDLDEAGGYSNATVNDIHGWNYNGALNVPIIADKLAIRLAGVIEENQGNRVRSLLSSLNPYDHTLSGRAAVRFEPFDFLSMSGSYQSTDRRTQQFGQVESFANVVPGSADGAVHIDPSDRLAYAKSPTQNHQQFKIWNWQAQLRYAGQRLIYVGSKTDSSTLSKGADSDAANIFPTQVIRGDTLSLSTSRSHEIRLQNEDRIADMFDYVAGYFYNKLDSMPANGSGTTLTNNTIVTAPSFRLIQTQIRQGSATLEKSYFANLTAHLGENTEISGGARHISYDMVQVLTINGVASPAANPPPDSFEHWIYSVSLKHRFNQNLMAYASFGTSWRPGSVAVGDFSVNQSQRETDFTHQSPETSKSFEIGFKADFLDHRARLNVSAYQQDFNNYPFHPNSTIYYLSFAQNPANPAAPIASVASGGTAFNFVAETKVRARGVEAEASFQATPHFNIGGTLNYALGKIRNGVLPCNDLNGDGVPDQLAAPPTVAQLQAIPNYAINHLAICTGSPRSSFSPVWSGVAHFDYTLSLDFAGGSEAFARGLFSWNGKTANDPNNPFDDIGSYGLLNGYLGLRSRSGDWELTLYGKNLFNKLVVLTRNSAPQSTSFSGLPVGGRASPVLSPYIGISVNEPREFGINLRVAFGSR
ncbi:TonB-dependent receptor [Novosphingobium sp. G106]|uniref:TonB-dependent receptor n=1 Tax=Novosphingobium sp. G106 TaxID=2849500 RepID=UPI001C2CE6A6|nr:TonB-dependent receptor [Novosphingobium sp. G106]MBV1691032.1 TonB-dependent receptor [Novosphingobium sp. G106]